MTLLERHCTRAAPALDPQSTRALLAQVPAWHVVNGSIAREYTFADYRATIAFVNAVATMAENEDHHPEMKLAYRRCTVAYTTHSAGGALTGNDFICAAKADSLYAQGTGA